ncbi:hypothetical protein LLH06_00365 [Mucilaginibacter daejeonensis]|uniref:hypothetical protein n=1 Tax=Mucilaginibacter daejeonensis TaxID=398049 RepID=UPI001D173EF2|nr:hypothetical protein [Mucilaginibacter daejeonensis]UEG53430.1 hypothetical protein LLH06_00365 [Mucilaginibacter daejeonensis]
MAVVHASFAQRVDTIHQEWVQDDIGLLKTLEAIDKNDPAAMEKFFLQFDRAKERDTLGFGWTVFSQGKGAGYISVHADFYHYKGKIVSYQLHSRAPSRKELMEQYKTMFAKLLPIDSNGFYYYMFNEAAILKPLATYNGSNKQISTDLLALMSPTSGTTYGIGGGMPPSMLPNRKAFNALKDKLSNDDVITLMYAINPATRLMAFEFYRRNRNRFSNQGEIEAWMIKVYKEKPTIETLSGCFVFHERVEKLVNQFYMLNMKEY